jgi:hypothetical protein
MSDKEAYDRRRKEKESRLEKRNAERFVNRVLEPNFLIQFLLVLCTAGLIAVGILQKWTFDKTDQTLRDTLAASRLSQRAWLAVDVALDEQEPFKYSRTDGAKIKLKITLRNTGNEPALDILPEIKMTFDPIGRTQDFSGIRKDCSELQRAPVRLEDSYGDALFPRDTRSFPYEVGMNAGELQNTIVGTKSFIPLIVGCFDYVFANGEGGRHQTGFAFFLKRKDDRLFYVDELSTTNDLLKLEPWIGGGFYAN